MGPGMPLPRSLSEFCNRDYWDAFFKARGGRPFEWYGDWNLVSKLVTEECCLKFNSEEKILIPGCGNSSVSASMYDAGFIHITNIDFSRVVISEMLRQHVRSRPCMRWLVMDMTKMQFSSNSFDVVVDKGGLDALLGEPEDDRSSGVLLLSEVKRVLKPFGRFACITLAQQHVIESLLCTFRENWHLSVHSLQLSAADGPSSLQAFLVIAKQDSKANLPQVSSDLDLDWRGSSYKFQMQAVVEAVDAENKLRKQGLVDFGIMQVPEINPQDSYEELHPGRRLAVKLGSHQSQFTYTGVILDAKEDIKPEYQCAVFLVPKGREHEWLFSSIEGQWQVAESTKAGRLILVTLDSLHNVDNILNVKDDLSPLVKCFFPFICRESGNVPYMTQGDGVASRNILAKVDSPMTGTMVVEDVVLEDEKPSINKPAGTKLKCFRRLVFRRNPNLIQSEGLLTREEVTSQSMDKKYSHGGTSRKHGTIKRKKKATKDISCLANPGIFEELKVDHSYLASPYHAGMISAFVLIAKNLEQWLASKEQIKLMLIGLGAGLLPMFVHNHLPIDDIQIVELDPVVAEVAKLHFGFIEDDRMKLQIRDGIVAVQSIAATVSPSSLQQALHDNSHGPKRLMLGSNLGTPFAQSLKDENVSTLDKSSKSREGDHDTNLHDGIVACQNEEEGSTDGSLEKHLNALEVVEEENRPPTCRDSGADCRLHVLIIDADSEDSSLGLSCPPPEFLEDSFLLAARATLVNGGMLIINVVSRSTSHHVQCVTQLKRLFEEVYDIQGNEDVNRVLIALPQSRNSGKSSDIKEDLFKLEKIVKQFASWGNGPNMKDILRDLKRLK